MKPQRSRTGWSCGQQKEIFAASYLPCQSLQLAKVIRIECRVHVNSVLALFNIVSVNYLKTKETAGTLNLSSNPMQMVGIRRAPENNVLQLFRTCSHLAGTTNLSIWIQGQLFSKTTPAAQID